MIRVSNNNNGAGNINNMVAQIQVKLQTMQSEALVQKEESR